MEDRIISVGIDVGTSTTQLIFSRITLKNMAGPASVPRVRMIGKEILYRSRIHFTPLLGASLIDGEQTGEIIREEFSRAGMKAEDVDTGAVIITGESSRKENARQVAEALAGLAGNFVVATAGPDLESVLAGRGSGAAELSRERNCVVCNLDIGGGTTNISVFDRGVLRDTACLDIGGRLMKLDPDGTLTYMAPKIRRLAESMGIPLKEGEKPEKQALDRIVSRMTALLEEAVGLAPAAGWLETICTNHGLSAVWPIDLFTFSGGVADCIYRPEGRADFEYGDIGVLLGRAIRQSGFYQRGETAEGTETIRATVIGAGSHSMEVSGSTVCYRPELLPVQNIPVNRVTLRTPEDLETLGEELERSRKWYDEDCVAVSMQGLADPSFDEIEALADVLDAHIHDSPVILIIEKDIAKALGQALRRRRGRDMPLICLDSIHADSGDYVDIGRPAADGMVLPVIVKTLIFGG